MNVRDAVAKAKTYLSAVFADEDFSGLRLEEVEYDRDDRTWLITLGIMMPDIPQKFRRIENVAERVPLKREYKIVRIPEDDKELPSIKIRELSDE